MNPPKVKCTMLRLRSFCLILLWALGPMVIASAEVPAGILNLQSWQLTLPIDRDGDDRPDLVDTRKLATFADPKFFHVNDAQSGVVLRAHCGGVTTRNSSYPRCELRELTADGKRLADWSTADAVVHRLSVRLSIEHLPKVKPHVVCVQIHDADDDLMMVRLEREKLFIERNDLPAVMLNRHYALGTSFDVVIEAGRGRVRVFYNADLKMDWNIDAPGCYFKAGCYTQSNISKGDDAEAYAEVVIDRLETLVQVPGTRQPDLKIND